MTKTYIALTEEKTGQPSNEKGFEDPLPSLTARGLKTARLTIAPLKAGWKTTLPDNWYRSGAAPIHALYDGVNAIKTGEIDAVLIHGEENLATGYTRQERHQLMDIYAPTTIPEAYDKLAAAYCAQRGISETKFLKAAEDLYQNYLHTYKKCAGDKCEIPTQKWHAPITPLQRGIDCANPLIDWQGQLLLANGKALNHIGIPPEAEILGVGYSQLPVDGPENTEEIAAFNHLEKAIKEAEEKAKATIKNLVDAQMAHLEIYTCYPVVPLAFLQTGGLIQTLEDIPELLEKTPLTVTGGMNLARAPWNLPALRGLIRVTKTLKQNHKTHGIIHGNGGLGYAQGIAIIKKIGPP